MTSQNRSNKCFNLGSPEGDEERKERKRQRREEKEKRRREKKKMKAMLSVNIISGNIFTFIRGKFFKSFGEEYHVVKSVREYNSCGEEYNLEKREMGSNIIFQ